MDLVYQQVSFMGGLAARYDQLRPQSDAYPLLVNGRVRDNAVTPINKPLEDTTLIGGVKQNITAVGSILIAFVAGQAWYRDTDTTNGWRNIPGVALDATTDVIDTCSIPASTVNYKRSGPVDAVSFNNSSARATEEGILAADGIGQDYLIYPQLGGTLAGRITQTYAQWTETTDGSQREYVPIGRFPTFAGQKLYKVIKSSGGFLNRIAGSVSGRPLDFVIAIDNTTGDKAGDALFTAHSVGFDPVSGLYATSFDDGSFVVTTPNNTVGVTPDLFNGTFFGEPYLRNTPLFPTGALNGKAAVDVNGDTAFITPTGIHSFDATAQKKVASNNDPIAIQIQRLLAEVQTFGAAISFRDYAFFAIDTIFGPGVAVYDKTLAGPDNKLGRFIGLDLYAGIGQIKQFARTTSPTGDRLFFITADDRLFEFGAASTRETCRFYIGDWNSGSGSVSQTFSRALAVFSNVVEEGNIQVTQYSDKEVVEKVSYPFQPGTVSEAPIIPLPYRIPANKSNGVVNYQAASGRLGFAVGVMFEWNTSAQLVFASIESTADPKAPGTLSQLYQRSLTPDTASRRFAFVGDTAPGDVVNALVRLPTDVTVIGLGDFFYGANHVADYAAYASTLQVLRAQGRLHTIAGNHDLDIDGGLQINNTFNNGSRYKSVVIGVCEFFFYNAGWNTATLGTNPPLANLEPNGNDVNSVQASWLKASLAASTAQFKFVIMHEPPYSSSTYSPGYTTLRLPFRAWGATAVFAGHDHNYQRHIVDGLNYLTVGTGGHSLRPISATPLDEFQAGEDEAYGYVLATVDAFNVTTEFITVGATAAPFDRFTFS